MKKFKSLTAILIIILGITAHVYAKSGQQTIEAETALMEKLLPLIQKGLVIPAKIEPQDEDGLVWIEPLLWEKLTHVQKYELMKSIGAFYSVHNKLKGTHIKGAMASDITSKKSLGLINLESGKITIKK